MKRFWLIMSWIAATTIVSFAAFYALSAAQGEVNERPLTPVVVASTVADALDTTTAPAPVSTTLSSTTTSITGERTASSATTTTESQPSDTAPAVSTTTAPTTTTTSTTTASTTTTTEAEWTVTTVYSPGGSLTVAYRPGEVRYEAAVPAAGYEFEVDSASPEVRVEFTSDDLPEYEIRVRWKDGALDTDVNEKG